MILTLNVQQTTNTLLSMSIMRKSVRNELKKQKKKDYLSNWDFITQSFTDALESTSEVKTFHFNIREVEVLHNFLTNYTNKYESMLNKAKVESKGDEALIEDLKEVEAKCLKLIDF